MGEVIARKREGLLALYIVTLIFVIAFIVGGNLSLRAVGNWTAGIWLIFVLEAFLIGVCGWVLIGILRTPQVMITYENGKLYFANGVECSPQEIASVNYRRAHARGISYRWGKLIVTVHGQEIKYNYVADVEQAHDRILALMLEAREKKD